MRRTVRVLSGIEGRGRRRFGPALTECGKPDADGRILN
jgi:hypothetical protein